MMKTVNHKLSLRRKYYHKTTIPPFHLDKQIAKLFKLGRKICTFFFSANKNKTRPGQVSLEMNNHLRGSRSDYCNTKVKNK